MILLPLFSSTHMRFFYLLQTGFWSPLPFHDVIQQMEEHSKKLLQLGWKVVRMKCETTPVTTVGRVNCPIENVDAANYPPTNYFEFHVKIQLFFDDVYDIRLATLKDLTLKHHGHLSKNAFKSFSDQEHRFVTFRCYHLGLKAASAKVDIFVDDVLSHHLSILQVQREYAVWDTNVDHDSGWIVQTAERDGPNIQLRARL